MIEQSIPQPVRKRTRRRMETRATGVPREQVESLIRPENVTRERLLELFDFLEKRGPEQPPQLDIVGSARLSLGYFTIGEANSVFNEYEEISSRGVGEDDRTYLALRSAIRTILEHRDGKVKLPISF